jgi:squalene synthase HpnC
MAAFVETPSGKGARDENFPVGSWLLAPRLRPHIALFYAYARAIDDIADNPDLAPADKVARLEEFEAAITGKVKGTPGFDKADRLRRSLLETGVGPVHCVDLVSAFKQDATKLRYRDWDDLMDYCNRSAAPVGRYLLDLHGESKDGYAASDALCNALQVINHLQDCKVDYLRLDRVYLPLDWMAAARVDVAELGAAETRPGLRKVLDHALDGVDDLLAVARELPGKLKSRRLAMESSAIVCIAERLTRLLRQRDPVAERVQLSPPAFLLCCLSGVWRVVAAAA